MAVRILKPSRVAPEVPSDVAMTVEREIHRHDLALEGQVPGHEEIVKSLSDELDRVYEEYDGRVSEQVERACYRANTAWMIWEVIRDYAFTAPENIPAIPDARLQHALMGMTLASLIRTGVDLAEWNETWQDSPYGGIAWPSDMHAVCAAVGDIARIGLGGTAKALDLAADLRDDAAAMLGTVTIGD